MFRGLSRLAPNIRNGREMKVLLVQHGDAVAKDVDPLRPLSDRGRADAARLAFLLRTAGTRVSRVMHSGKRRAEETAAMLSTAVCPGRPLEEVSGIDPNDPVDVFARQVDAWTVDTMVVGHLPFLGKLVSYLLTGSESTSTVAFVPGTAVCLERQEGQQWSITAMVGPELIGETKP
jgi:phosphohistidine phosphatase